MDMFSDSENAAQTVEKAQQFIALHHVQYTQSYNDEIIDTTSVVHLAYLWIPYFMTIQSFVFQCWS